MTTSFHILSHSSFTYHPFIRRYIVRGSYNESLNCKQTSNQILKTSNIFSTTSTRRLQCVSGDLAKCLWIDVDMLPTVCSILCFTSSRLRRLFQNEQMLCSWIHHARTCTSLRNWYEQRPSNKGGLDSSVTGEVGTVSCTEMDLIMISFSYRSTCLFFDCVLNYTPYT
jgi:hypothetical protein